jgi:hypothetical protein
MNFEWAGFLANGRLRSAERGLADVRETLALLTAQAPLIGEQARALAALADRVTALEAQSQARREMEGKKAEDAFLHDAQMEVMGEDLVRMRRILAGLERRMNHDMDETRRIATALLERIEQARPAPSS